MDSPMLTHYWDHVGGIAACGLPAVPITTANLIAAKVAAANPVYCPACIAKVGQP